MKDIYKGLLILSPAIIVALGVLPYLMWSMQLHSLGISLKTTMFFNLLIWVITPLIVGGDDKRDALVEQSETEGKDAV